MADKERISITINPQVLDEIDEYAEESNRNRSAAVEHLVSEALDAEAAEAEQQTEDSIKHIVAATGAAVFVIALALFGVTLTNATNLSSIIGIESSILLVLAPPLTFILLVSFALLARGIIHLLK